MKPSMGLNAPFAIISRSDTSRRRSLIRGIEGARSSSVSRSTPLNSRFISRPPCGWIVSIDSVPHSWNDCSQDKQREYASPQKDVKLGEWRGGSRGEEGRGDAETGDEAKGRTGTRSADASLENARSLSINAGNP